MNPPQVRVPPVVLNPSIQHYLWGDTDFIPRVLGRFADGRPWAEAWYGAHPVAPSQVADATAEPLNAWLARFGQTVTAYASGGLPYLLKVLAAAKPLSIQVHPDPVQAAAGFAREEAAGIPRDAPHRCYRDNQAKPEVLVALSNFEALCGFRSPGEITEALRAVPELAELLPAHDGTVAGIKTLLTEYFSLPMARVQPALQRWLDRLAKANTGAIAAYDASWVLRAHQELSPLDAPDRGLLFFLLLKHLRLKPGDAIFLGAGIPHAYLQGAGIELMANSDNVLRAGLTSKHVDPEELLRIVRFDASGPSLIKAVPGAHDAEWNYPLPIDDFALTRLRVTPGRPLPPRVAAGREMLLLVSHEPVAVRVISPEGEAALQRGQACLLSDGLSHRIESDAEATLFSVRLPRAMVSDDDAWAQAIRRNIEHTQSLFTSGDPPRVLGTVSGSAGAQRFWQEALDRARPGFRADAAVSLHEDLPVNQALGLLLLWQRIRQHYTPGGGALVAFVFGEGTRATPLTEAECGQKPAIWTFSATGDDVSKRFLSTVELALRYFAPVEAYLRRSGFEGLVVKWGDEVQIPTLDLSGSDSRLAGADVVRFVSMRAITEDDAANKDWVGVDAAGNVTTFIPRRPLAAMAPLAERGWLQRRDGTLYGGVNLGSIAVSSALLDVLLEAFAADVNDPHADRAARPDLDPQLFTALTVAAIEDPVDRARMWDQAVSESGALQAMVRHMPEVMMRLRGALDRFAERQGRPVRLVALDFGDQYWGDLGQHPKIFEFYAASNQVGAEGTIARALAGLGSARDVNGNLISEGTVLGPEVQVRNSVLVDARVDRGVIESSVLIGTRCGTLHARGAVDVGSVAMGLDLAPRAGTYRVVSATPVAVAAGVRATTVFAPGAEWLLRVDETTDLRDRARNYDIPVGGNPVSFAEAHRAVTQADPQALHAQRQAREEEVKRRLAEERAS